MVIYDKERDDQPFTPSEKDALDGTEGVVTENSVVNGYSHQSRDVERTANIFHVTKPAGNSKQTSKHNPVSHWKVTKKSITCELQPWSYYRLLTIQPLHSHQTANTSPSYLKMAVYV